MEQKKPRRKKSQDPNKESRWGFRGMTVRSWLELLIVPFALAVIGFWFTMQQDARQQWIEDRRAQEAQKIENQRAEAERAIQQLNAQEEALQAYLNQMSILLLEKDLRNSEEGSEARTLARARTLTVLGRLDPSRKTAVMQFLDEASLVRGVDERDPIIRLEGAELYGADLYGANLSYTDLSYADLRKANLSGVTGVSNEELEQQARSLEGATMPNGQNYEDWLKSKGRGEDGENSGPS